MLARLARVEGVQYVGHDYGSLPILYVSICIYVSLFSPIIYYYYAVSESVRRLYLLSICSDMITDLSPSYM